MISQDLKANLTQNVSITPRLKYSQFRSPILAAQDMFNHNLKRANSQIDLDFVNFIERGSPLLDLEDLLGSNNAPV